MWTKPPDYISRYTATTPNGNVECWDVEEALGLDKHHYIASAFAYIWRCLRKGDTLGDLVKARNYLNREIANLEKEKVKLESK